ncbi:MAG: cyclic nucleotide-binding/CBS domain-containing protein [Nitrososphaerales archaeon]
MSLSTISVSEILKKDVKTAKGSEPILYAIGLMAKHKISSIVIVDEKDKPIGIFTEKDAIRIIPEHKRPLILELKFVMSSPLVTVPPTSSLLSVLMLMSQKNINHIPVAENEKLVGIVTEKDLFRYVLHHTGFIVELLAQGPQNITVRMLEGFSTEMVGADVWPEPHRTK